MNMIYKQATEVVVWRGLTYNNSDLAIRSIYKLYKHHDSTAWIMERFSKQDMKQDLESVANLFDHGY